MSCRIGIEVTSPSTLSRSRQGEVGGPRNGTVLRDAAREGEGGRRMRGLRGAARKISVAGKLLALCCLHAVPTTKHGSTLCDIHTLPHPPRSGGKKARGAAASKSPPTPRGSSARAGGRASAVRRLSISSAVAVGLCPRSAAADRRFRRRSADLLPRAGAPGPPPEQLAEPNSAPERTWEAPRYGAQP